MDLSLLKTWEPVLSTEFNKPYFKALSDFVNQAYAAHTCYPPKDQIFAAFDYCPFDKVKVVIIGQDPYHGPNQANGLCFSVQQGIKQPPSLVNIFKELNSDLNLPIPLSGDLSPWAKQGVLLINATLTVEASKAGSHQKKGWETFTDAVIEKISAEKKGVVFLLWGGFAHKKGVKIDSKKHVVIKTGHPSPLSANRGYWFGNKHFSKTNDYLIKQGEQPIDWSLN
ncbi:uracil-DNA glycosylase [Putridiphycobacter roseus]|uniref:Uracil-DNA glycosylase n=1 Tax=Putridiphycobacter roseus TaxID=2219161 RepID=A0A2W1MYA4_9FLAO|nr:uracil-DNA glycosylase [Putridiphycobacter roseus]PZE17149.1 uracil-DNA glycosylase [Putridiphycobacter roseus]